MQRYAWLVILGSLVGCEGRRPAGGPCTYVDFAGTCELADMTVAVGSAKTTLTATYRFALGSGTVPLDKEVTVESARVDAAKAYFASHKSAPCHGQRIVKGSCTPFSGTVELPDPP
jgi:hypothetical protein